MSDTSAFFAELYAEIDRRIRQALKEYRPDLTKASNGALPVNYVPVIGTSKIEDGSITEAKLSFDPATQTELNAEASTRAAADTAEASARAAADTALAAPSYVTIGSSATLANERTIAAGVNIQLTDGGANSTLEIAADHTHGVQASGEWTWKSAATTSDPGSNNVGVNNDSPSLATTLWINKFGPNTVDYSGILSALRANDTIYLQQANSASSWHRYDVTGTPTLSGSAYAVPVSTLGGSAQGTEPMNNTKVYIVINQGATPTALTGAGTAGQVAYWSAGTVLAGDSGLIWDETNNRLGVGASTPAASLHSVKDGSGAQEALRLDNNTNTSSNGSKIAWRNAAQTYDTAIVQSVRNGAGVDFLLQLGATSNFSGVDAAALVTITSANVGIGTSAPATKLQTRGAVSSFGFYDADAIGGTEVEILPAGSCVYTFLIGAYAVRASTGTVTVNSALSVNVPGASSTSANLATDGTNTLVVRVYSTGRVTTVRTAGSATYKLTMNYNAL